MVSEGDVIDLGGSKVEILGPLDINTARQNLSLILKLSYGNSSFLFPGDADREEERDLIELGKDISASVLHVPHHGSEESNEYRFVKSVSPKYAVISVGKNNRYGHPDEKTLSVLAQAIENHNNIFRTDLLGTIACFTDGQIILFGDEAVDRIEAMIHGNASLSIGEEIGPSQKYTADELAKAESILNRIINNELQSLPGYKPERTFGNYEETLPKGIKYTEYDINPLPEAGKRRDEYRLVLGNDGSAWYTHNHYKSFIRIR